MVLHTHKSSLQALWFRKLKRSSHFSTLLLAEDDYTLFFSSQALIPPLFFCKWQAAHCHTQTWMPPLSAELTSTLLWSRVQSIAEAGRVCFWGGVVCKFKTYFWPLGTQMGNSKALFNFLFALWFFQFKLQKHALFFLVFSEQVQLR